MTGIEPAPEHWRCPESRSEVLRAAVTPCPRAFLFLPAKLFDGLHICLFNRRKFFNLEFPVFFYRLCLCLFVGYRTCIGKERPSCRRQCVVKLPDIILHIHRPVLHSLDFRKVEISGNEIVQNDYSILYPLMGPA